MLQLTKGLVLILGTYGFLELVLRQGVKRVCFSHNYMKSLQELSGLVIVFFYGPNCDDIYIMLTHFVLRAYPLVSLLCNPEILAYRCWKLIFFLCRLDVKGI